MERNMQKRNVLLIINPNASKGKGEAKAKKIAELFSSQGVMCTTAYTVGPGHATKLAKSGVENGFREIVAAGGDGTVNEVLNGIMQSENHEGVKMGIIPVGRGNDFAWMAKIPTDMAKAVKIIVDGEAKSTDVGFGKGRRREEGLYFLNGMGFGFEPMVNYKAQEYKHINGMASYVVAFIWIVMNPPKPYSITLDLDGQKETLECQQISVNNGRRMGSSFHLTPRAEIDDGLFDVMNTTRPFLGLKLIRMVISFLRGAVLKDKEHFTYRNARKVIIDCTEPVVPAHADGETFTMGDDHFELEILPGAIDLFRR